MKQILYSLIALAMTFSGCKKSSDKDPEPNAPANLSFKITKQTRYYNTVSLNWSKAKGTAVDTSLKYTVSLNGQTLATLKDTTYTFNNILGTLNYTGHITATSKGITTQVDITIAAEPGFIYGSDFNIYKTEPDYACYSTTGHYVWSKPLGMSSFAVISNDTLFVQSKKDNEAKSYIHALNAKTGATLWSVVEERSELATNVLYQQGTLFVLHSNKLFAYNAANGQFLWGMTNEAAHYAYGIPEASNSLFAITNMTLDNVTNLTVYDARTGKEKWKLSKPNSRLGEPCINNGNLYIIEWYATANWGANVVGELFVFDAYTGTKKWSYKFSGGSGTSRPRIIGTSVFFSTYSANSQDNNLYALNKDAGTLVWKVAAVDGALSVNSTGLYITDWRGTTKFNIVNGAVEWFKTIGNNPVLTPEKIYATTGYKVFQPESYLLKAADTKTGTIDANSSLPLKFSGFVTVLSNNVVYYPAESGMYRPGN